MGCEPPDYRLDHYMWGAGLLTFIIALGMSGVGCPGLPSAAAFSFRCVQVMMAKRTQSSRPARAARSPQMPGFVKPQLAPLKSKAPVGSQWLHEIKFDGYRVQVHLNHGKRKVYTRNGLDWTKRFSLIAGLRSCAAQLSAQP
jgi:ATP-dependent DNA ligase